MLQKMGWSEGEGLGLNGTGMKENLKVSLKANNEGFIYFFKILGLGMSSKNSSNWIDGTSAFDSLLQELNSNTENSIVTIKKSSTDKKERKKKKEKKEKIKKSEPTSHAIDQNTRLYHRSKYLKNKNVSTYGSKDLKEIFGN